MNKRYTFQNIKHLEAKYPRPIASVLYRARVADKNDLGGRHKKYIDLFEVLIKFLSVIELQEARNNISNLKDILPQKEKTLDFLRRPTLGGWVGMIRIFSSLQNINLEWTQKISDWFNQHKNSEGTLILTLLGEIKGLNFESRTHAQNAEICNALVTYRNKLFGHAASLQKEELIKNLCILENILTYLLESASFLQEMQMFNSGRIEVAENNKWLIYGTWLTGLSDEPMELICDTKLNLSEVYLMSTKDGKLIDAPISLCPFLLWESNEDLKNKEIFFYNDAWRTKLEYISYASGSRYYHKELHSRFSDLITLKVKPGVEEDPHYLLSSEERIERASHYYKRAMLLKEDERYEDVLEVLEVAAEYSRNIEIFLEIAKIQLKLQEPVEGVIQTLQVCLEIAPDNKEAMALKSSCEDGELQNAEYKIEDEGIETPFPCIFHAFMFKPLRKYGLGSWLILFTVWYSLSFYIEFKYGTQKTITVVFMQYLLCVLSFAALFILRPMFMRMQLPLSLQIESMRLDRFKDWYKKQLEFIAGTFVFHNEKLQLIQTLKKEPFYYIGLTVWLFVMGIAGSLLAELYKLPVPMSLKVFIDNILIFGFIAYFAARYIIGSILFIYRLSKLSMKPMLTKINDDGLRSLGPLMTTNIVFMNILFVIMLLMAKLQVSSNSYIDILLLLLYLIILFVVSIGMPLTIRMAAKQAKSRAVHTYSEHIENAFKSFLAQPDEGTLGRYQWLIANQKAIVKICIWPLSTIETLLVFGSNLLLVGMTAWYIFSRTGYWPNFVQWLNRVI